MHGQKVIVALRITEDNDSVAGQHTDLVAIIIRAQESLKVDGTPTRYLILLPYMSCLFASIMDTTSDLACPISFSCQDYEPINTCVHHMGSRSIKNLYYQDDRGLLMVDILVS